MQLIITDNYESLSARAADFIAEDLRRCPDLLLCAASGSTPTGTYDRLATKLREAPDLCARLRLIKLDEWGGLAMDDAATCEVYIQRHVVKPLRVASKRYISFDSLPEDPEVECARIQRELEKAGPIGLCILGLGINGHLALNEPARQLQPSAHVAQLTEESLQHSMLEETKESCKYGLSLGMADILQSRKILLLVSGEHKSAQVARLRERKVSTQSPASFLWLHPDVTCLCDRDAAASIVDT